ncbi:MAG TPA: isochorismatase family cysteine hydrolase [Caulobacteraceae bacterium]|nr:isochorismatase family cysteine hydrolase [Caulobacteraceae bacterium]
MNDASIENGATGGAALLIIDMINDLDFPGAEGLIAEIEPVADVILKLRDEADRRGAPVVYVNDNFGQWHSERSRLVDHCRRAGTAGARMVERLAPREDDYFVIKPQLSGFYATNLPVLLPKLGADRVILTGVAADICILFTAADAHMREYDLWIPGDATAANSRQRKAWALDIMQQAFGAETRPTDELALADWLAAGR